MICVSSFRPFAHSEVYRKNQIRAWKSWVPLFSRIIYLNEPEPELSGDNTEFCPSEPWPKISECARIASLYREGAAIVNADIVLGANVVGAFEIIERKNMSALTSRRFDLETGLLDPLDRGRDIFICTQRVWQSVFKEVPDSCRIGHQQWDSFMIAFLRKTLNKRFGEFTQMKCVFHPKHEERHMPYADQENIDGPYKGYWDGTQDVQVV